MIDQSDLILLAVRPLQIDDLLSDLSFPKGKIVVSAVVGVTLEQLRNKVYLPEKLCRILPLVGAESAQGFIPVFPVIDEVRTLTDSIGKSIVFENESQFEYASAMGTVNGWMYRFFDEQVNWLIRYGIDAENARQMFLHKTLGAAHYALGRPEQSLAELGEEIAREGTYTKLGLDYLEDAGAFKQWSDALDIIKSKLDASHN